jgi:serine/threonine protein phosphatase PrpC
MRFTTANYTDIGTRKKTNQDSMLIMQAETSMGTVLMATVCDGMGGLAKGEVASAAMVRMLSVWFQTELPVLLANGFQAEQLRISWENLISNASRKVSAYGQQIHVDMGTTAVVFLIVGDIYYILNVGDSRAYLISDAVYQLTKDQTFVQNEIDNGRMTEAEAAMSPQKNVLLQCIGASSIARPDFVAGQVVPGQVYMLCCDGFRHVIQPSEFYDAFNYRALKNQKVMVEAAKNITDLNIQRGESDNISVILVKVDN